LVSKLTLHNLSLHINGGSFVKSHSFVTPFSVTLDFEINMLVTDSFNLIYETSAITQIVSP